MSLVFGIILSVNVVNASVRKANIEELTKGSNHLIIGKVVDVYSQFVDLITKEIYTYVVLNLHESIKGNFKDKNITVRFPRGVVGDVGT